MDVLAQPAEQRRELTAPDLLHGVRRAGHVRVPKQRRVHGAQRVGREVAERAVRPVDVLHHPQRVVGRPHPQLLFVGVIPRLGQLGHLELFAQQRQLELESDQHVHVVGDLVRLNADQGRLDPVGGPEQVVRLGIRQLVREQLPRHRRVVLPKLAASSDDVLPQPRL